VTTFRRLRRPALLGLLALLFAACRSTATPTTEPTATASTPSPVPASATPAPTATPLPDARGTTEAYLAAWQAGDYAAMYALLAPESRAALAAADFEQQYRQNLSIMSSQAYTPTLTGANATGDAAEAQAHISYQTVLVGTLETDVVISLNQVDGRWGVVYSPAMIWPELVNGQQLYMVYFVPDRGTIYDRNGLPMAGAADAYAVGVVPGEIEDPDAVASAMGRVLRVPAQLVPPRYEFAPPDQYFPIGEISAAELSRLGGATGLPGTRWDPYHSRFYFGRGAGAHVTGYTTFIQPDQLADFQARGYASDQRLGTTGLEAWGEDALAGHNGGQLTLLDAAGNPLRAIAFGDPTPAQDIYTTIDFALQQEAQFALGDFTGAVVVLDRSTGEVLALASNPTFNPNLFDPNNLNFGFTNGGSGEGLLNRATQDAYPAGSIFKIVTFSAGLTSGLFTPASEYTCNGFFDEVAGFPGKDWKEGGHGTLNMKEGLTGSCNPWFWHIGKALFDWNPDWLSQTARAFKLGEAAGLEGIEETPGRIPDPAWKLQTQGQTWEVLDNLNTAIGQGDVLVTPLQIARMVGAVGNAGTLMQPQLVLRIQAPDGPVTYQFRPKVAGQLPLNEEQLNALQEAMHNVTQEPIGTARNRFRNLRIPIAGKTGTAETAVADPDAWFAGYTFANRPDRPDIAVAVWVSNRGQGSDVAAPIFRRVIEAYFGIPYLRYPWEESVGVPATPEPTPTGEGTTAAP
jgi:penicillin-binding protein 2